MIRVFKKSLPPTKVNVIVIINQSIVESYNIAVMILVSSIVRRKLCLLEKD